MAGAILALVGSIQAQTWDNATNDGGPNAQYGSGTARDASGNQIVVGSYQYGSATFGTGASSVTLANAGGVDGYVVKYNSSKALQWATRISGSGYNLALRTATDLNNDIYVCGKFTGSCAFYHANGTVYTTLNSGSSTIFDGFLAKYNASGVIQWITRVANTSANEDIVNVAYRNSMLIVTGSVGASTSSGGYSLPQGAFLARINPSNGSTQWAYTFVSTGSISSMVEATGLCIDNNNDIYVSSGASSGNIAYGLGTNYTVSGATGSGVPIYLKYQSTGAILWGRSATVSASGVSAGCTTIAADDNANVYISGILRTSASSQQVRFPTSSGSLNAFTNINTNCYVGKIDASNGNALWMTTDYNMDDVQLTTQGCGVMYAAFMSASTSTIGVTSGSQLVPSNPGINVAKFYSDGSLLSSSTWNIKSCMKDFHISSWSAYIDVVASCYDTNSLPLSGGGTYSFTPSNFDLVAGTFAHSTSFPPLSVSGTATPAQICIGDPTTLNVSVSGPGAPFSYVWEFYDNSTSSYVPVISTSVPNLALTSSMYSPYVYFNTILNIDICVMRVTINSCGRRPVTTTIFFVVHRPITYGAVTSQTICVSGGTPSPVFSVSSPNTNTYHWEVSCDNGANWSACTSPLYSNFNTAALTVNTPSISMNGCQYRCQLGSTYCGSVTTTPATLHISVACRTSVQKEEDNNSSIDATHTNLKEALIYPNPSNGFARLVINDLNEKEKQNLILEVIDISGRCVMKKAVVSSITDLNFENLQDGIYTYRIYGDRQLFHGKIALTH